MIQLYDVNHNKIAGLTNYKDIKRERELSGLETLSFSYPQSDSKCSLIKNEGFVRIKENEYVIKEVNPKTDWTEVVARVNTDDLYGNQFDNFDIEDNLQNTANLALAGTGWTANTDITKKRHISLKCKNTVDIITEMIDIWNCDIRYDAINKVVYFYNSMGSDKGAYFMDRLNLSELEVQGSSYDFITRLIPLGAKDLDITTVNGGLKYIDNHEYSSKVVIGYWRTKQYTDPQALKEDAAIRLAKYSKPVIAYNAKVIDLAKCSPDKYGILDYSLGDTITLIDKEKDINTKVKIVKTTEYLSEPEKNEVEIASRKQILQDLQISLMDAADSVDAVTNGDGESIDGSTIDSVDTSQLTGVDDLRLTSAQITDLSANYASIKDLSAATARIGTLEVTSATITQLNTANANIENLKTEKADIESLNATNANINTLKTDVASINTVLAGNVGAKNLAAGAIQAGSSVIGNAAISSAQIISLDVGKINAGDISTSKFRIKSDSGNMLMSDNTIQIKDSSRVRVQIGKDASNDYNMYVWDASGNLMFDAAGLKSNGIKDKIIRDDMVSDTANIDAKKINIDSLFTQMNGSTQTLKSSKIYLDTQAQTLNVAFSSLSNTVTAQGNTISNQTTTINTMQGQIATKVSQTDFNNSIDGVTTRIANAETSITQLSNSIELKASQSSLDTTNSNVGSLANRMSAAESTLSVQADAIKLKVTQSDINNSIELTRKNLIHTEEWVAGDAGAGFAHFGALTGSTNKIVKYTDPFGRQSDCWQVTDPGHHNTGGGYNTTQFTASDTKTYRFTVYFKSGADSNGTKYFGCDGSTTCNLDGSANTNPYFWCGNLPQLNQWYLLVGYVHSKDYTGGSIGGIYDMTGKLISSITDYKMMPGAAAQRARHYLYYVTAGAPELYIYGPTVQVVDGTEDSLDKFFPNIASRMYNAESSITQQAGLISSKVNVNGVISAINQTAESITIDARRLNLNGYVTISNLSNSGQTTINGSNIKTGTIDANMVKVVNLNADNITAGTIDASRLFYSGCYVPKFIVNPIYQNSCTPQIYQDNVGVSISTSISLSYAELIFPSSAGDFIWREGSYIPAILVTTSYYNTDAALYQIYFQDGSTGQWSWQNPNLSGLNGYIGGVRICLTPKQYGGNFNGTGTIRVSVSVQGLMY